MSITDLRAGRIYDAGSGEGRDVRVPAQTGDVNNGIMTRTGETRREGYGKEDHETDERE